MLKKTPQRKNVDNPSKKKVRSKYVLTYHIIPRPVAGEIMTW